MLKTIRIFFLLLLLLEFREAQSQCNITVSAIPDTVVCGDAVVLTIFGISDSGQVVFSENFNSGAPTGWAFTQQAMFNNPCSPGGVDGTTHIWMGNNSGVPRSLVTVPYDFTAAIAGATICFDMLMATQGAAAPCEGPDEPDEGVALQYSPTGTDPWTTIHYFDPNGGTDPSFINWQHWCFQLPPGAITPTTTIRWFQDNDSGPDYDHWGIDNVVIFFNDPTYTISIINTPISFPQGSSGGATPPIRLDSTTTFNIVMANSSGDSCFSSITVPMINPNLVVDAGRDTSVCIGNCVTLNAQAKVIKRPAKTPTYSNQEITQIQSGLVGATSPININVTSLNMTNILPGSITSVCITNLTYFGFQFAIPPVLLTIGDLELYLICPDGTRLRLVPSGVTTSATPFEGYINTCFTPTATTNIATASANYTGNFMPAQPLDNLVGCTANGVWSIEVVSTIATTIGVGTFSGWSITFNDPEISYTADFFWNPTTNMTNSTTLTPTICPTSDIAYTLTATDTAGCVTRSDTINISVDSLFVTADTTQPTCGNSNGAIDITVTSGSGNYGYVWSNAATTQDVVNLNAGSYTVTVTDIISGCQVDTAVALPNSDGPVIDSLIVTNETCFSDSNGTATVYTSGGAGTLTYIWSGGQTDASISSLAGGSYSVTISDSLNCIGVGVAVIAPGPVCCSLAVAIVQVNTGCNAANGSITIIVDPTSGTAPFQYSINGFNYGSNNVFGNLAAGTYRAIVRDAFLCADTTTVMILEANNNLASAASGIDVTCFGFNDGTASVSGSGGSGTYSYSWSNLLTSTQITGLGAGVYFVTTTDQNNCSVVDTVTITTPPAVIVDLGTDVDICTDANITLDAGNFSQYQWSSTETTSTISVAQSGVYSVTVFDADNCPGSDQVNVNLNNSPGLQIIPGNGDTTIPANTSLALFADVFSSVVNISGFSWIPSEFLSCDDCQSPIATPETDTTIFFVTYTDSTGCVSSDTITIRISRLQNYAFVPSAFTPNGDGPNDYITLIAENDRVVRFEFRIFNRWGEQVYSSTDVSTITNDASQKKGWNGTFKGDKQNVGVFTYFANVEFVNGEKRKLEGSITLIR